MTSFDQLAAIVLAAGFSRRMGGASKLLRPLGGKPLLAHALEQVAALGLKRIIVVTGEASDGIAPLIPPAALAIRNSRAADGMGASIAAGAAALDPAVAGAFIVLGDMPLVTRADYERLAAAFQASGHGAICVPVHEGRRGHPVLFPARCFPALTALTGDTGARRLLDDPAAGVREAPDCSSGILADFDTPEAFAAHEARTAGALKRCLRNFCAAFG